MSQKLIFGEPLRPAPGSPNSPTVAEVLAGKKPLDQNSCVWGGVAYSNGIYCIGGDVGVCMNGVWSWPGNTC